MTYISLDSAIQAVCKDCVMKENMACFEQCNDIDNLKSIPAADVRPMCISVEDALPENDGDYLAWFYDAKCWKVVEFNKHTAKERHVWWFAGIDRTKFVTHWMPLPEPPKEGR